MGGNDDEEALTWAGGRDPSHYETPEAKPKVARPTRKVGAEASTEARADAGAEASTEARAHAGAKSIY